MWYVHERLCMKVLVTVSFCVLLISGCVSQAKYSALKLEKSKAEAKAEKLNKKLDDLNIFQKHLQDSLNKML